MKITIDKIYGSWSILCVFWRPISRRDNPIYFWNVLYIVLRPLKNYNPKLQFVFMFIERFFVTFIFTFDYSIYLIKFSNFSSF